MGTPILTPPPPPHHTTAGAFPTPGNPQLLSGGLLDAGVLLAEADLHLDGNPGIAGPPSLAAPPGASPAALACPSSPAPALLCCWAAPQHAGLTMSQCCRPWIAKTVFALASVCNDLRDFYALSQAWA